MLRWSVATFIAIVSGLHSCNEQLPAYEDPRSLFKTALRIEHTYSHMGIYTLLLLKLVNRFDETLEDTLTIDGSITMTPLRAPTFRRSFTLNTTNIAYVRSYNPSTRILRVDPGDSIVFQAKYDYVDDEGRSLIDELFVFRGDPKCEFRLVSNRELFSVTGRARVFGRTTATAAEAIPFVICYVYPFVPEKVCPGNVSETSQCSD